MTSYKPHYACFRCRKTFKRKLWVDVDRNGAYNKTVESQPAKCPECGGIMADMGLDFESPKKSDIKAWNHLENLYKSGITFHSCGCTGPGYIPKDEEQLIDHLTRLRDWCLEHRRFWKNRIEPETPSEKQKDWNKNSDYLFAVPNEVQMGTRKKRQVDSQKAVQFWTHNLEQVEIRLQELSGR